MWARTTPSKEGFYWFRYFADPSKPRVYEIIERLDGVFVTHLGYGVEQLHGEWQPVAPPKE